MKQLLLILLLFSQSAFSEISIVRNTDDETLLSITARNVEGMEIFEAIAKEFEAPYLWFDPPTLGKVTISIEDENWLTVMNHIIKPWHYAKQGDDGILTIQDLGRWTNLPRDTRSFEIRSRPAQEVKAILDTLFEGESAPRFTADSGLNRLWVTAGPLHMNTIQEYLTQIDKQYRWNPEIKDFELWSRTQKKWKSMEEYDESVDGKIL